MRKLMIASFALALTGLAGGAGAATLVTSDVTTDTTWGPPGSGATVEEPVLDRPIFVKSGATLTILAGTVVRGQPRTAAVQPGVVQGTPGALIVTRTGRIRAEGNETNPIIFTTAAVDNDGDLIPDNADGDSFVDAWTPGDTFLDDDPRNDPLAPLNPAGEENVSLWGAVAIAGNATTNLDATGGAQNPVVVQFGETTFEGLTIPGFDIADAAYGGDLVHDSSGTFRFISIRHGGDEIGEANELNCLSLGGVGDATVIDHIECYSNFDDGIEWFGGSVDVQYAVSLFIGDDAFDLDQGYNGVAQFLLAVQPFFKQSDGSLFGSKSGDKAGEWDGDDSPNAAIRIDVNSADADPDARCTPFGDPIMTNLTVVGPASSVAAPCGGGSAFPGDDRTCGTADDIPVADDNGRIQMRNGFGGKLYNSLIANTGGAKGFEIDATDRTDATNCSDTIEHVNEGIVAVVASSFSNGAPLGTPENDALANGDGLGGGSNFVNSPLFTGFKSDDLTVLPITGKLASDICSTNATTFTDAGPDGTCGTGDDVVLAKIDPRPKAEPGVGSPFALGGRGVDPVTFRGAFDPGAPLWTTGWTILESVGLMVAQ